MRTLVVVLVFCATPVWAGNLCYTSSAAEDAAIADAVTREGTTTQAAVNAAVSQMIASKYNQALTATLGQALVNQWSSFTPTKKTNVCTALGVSPCPP